MYYLAVFVDTFHAFLMMAWILGLPLLFWHRFPKLTLYYAIFSVLFIIVNQVSHYTLGECVFTTLARKCFQIAPHNHPVSDEWFTVRFAQLIFGLTPQHRSIKILSEVLIFISAVGGIILYIKKRRYGKKEQLIPISSI